MGERQHLLKPNYVSAHSLTRENPSHANHFRVSSIFQLVNEPGVLNVTTLEVNRKKGGAVRKFLNRADQDRLRGKPLGDFLRENFGKDSSVPANIDSAIVQTYDDFVEKRLKRLPKSGMNDAARENFEDSLSRLVDKMKLDSFS